MTRRRVRVGARHWRPALPVELAEPARLPRFPADGSDEDRQAWPAECSARYQAHEAARAAWFAEHAGLPVDPATVPVDDEPFCGELVEHECLGADCPRRPAGRDVGLANPPTASGGGE